MRASLCVITALWAIACSNGSGSSDVANGDRLLALIEALANTAPAPGESCGVVLPRLEAVIEKRRRDFESLRPWMNEVRKDDPRLARIMDRMAPRMTAIRDRMKSLVACESELKKAAPQLQGLMKLDGL
jgi:hypothetical protein